MKAKKLILTLVGLLALQLLIDLLFVYIYPLVGPLRATMIGATAFLVLGGIHLSKKELVNPVLGGLSIFSSALFGALLVQAGVLVSKSTLSGAVHGLILIVAFLVLSWGYDVYKQRF